ncbi:hypothetical protein DFA_01111 [Cavenderia fasciculata]|uniref:Uncharacterized protein n=1 Tax=Cavenderia fasciculata TaxID=261658 RepID=F4PQX1_CACFS|nr:uncharacterized protein DFA_01111 [Cavenderia fasciculata]EGG21236.1 hypothetical protein DFA_01111 [Cavenderia fasciculata]|eukprot:XP_004359086.1 hypothetical protein DFA_01111 [Cavenderia fasciculata]
MNYSLLLVFVVAIFFNFSVVNATNTNSWVTIETFNEPKCDSDSSSIGGIVLISGTCINGQQVSCNTNNNIVTVEQYKDKECQTTVTNTTEHSSGVCYTVSQDNGFYKTFTCSATTPSYPARSLAISTYSTCQQTNKQLETLRWIPSYKCMAILRGSTPGTGTESASASATISSGSGSGSGSGSSSGSVLRNHHNFNSNQFNNQISTVDILDRYFDFLDEINFPTTIEEEEEEDLFKVSHRIGSGSGGVQTGTGYGTGTGSSGGGPFNSAMYGIVLCNQTYNSYNTYANQIPTGSATHSGVMSTGKYSTGDPYGSQMGIPTKSGGSGSSGGGSGSGSGGSGISSPNSCSIQAVVTSIGKNTQQCYQNQLIAVTCTPPYTHA